MIECDIFSELKEGFEARDGYSNGEKHLKLIVLVLILPLSLQKILLQCERG